MGVGSETPTIGERSRDLVVVVPGFMGSELVERETGRVLWGMPAIAGYGARWRHREGFAALRVTDEERAGRAGRVEATRILSAPAWAPLIGGLEPYGRLMKRLRTAVIDPDAIRPFAYDWRLGLAHNARELAVAIRRHLADWRAHPVHRAAQRRYQIDRTPQVVLVAHSMGGLVVREMAGLSDTTDVMADVRDTITLGTPFHGSLKAVEVLASGRGTPVPFPTGPLQKLAAGMPGLHELLPSYKCRLHNDDLVALQPTDIEAIGGDRQLATDAFDARHDIADVALTRHKLIVGTSQPTAQSVEFRDGIVACHMYRYDRDDDGYLVRDEIGRLARVDRGGDGTVYRYAAHLASVPEIPIVQQHGALPRTSRVLDIVCGVVTDVRDLGAVLGAGDVGLAVPEIAGVGDSLTITVTGDVDPAKISCTVEDASDDRVIAHPRLTSRGDDQSLQAAVVTSEPGLYRVSVAAGGDPVSAIVLVEHADAGRE